MAKDKFKELAEAFANYFDLSQWSSNVFKISTLRSLKVFSITHGALFFIHNSSEEQKERLSRPQMYNQAQLNG